MFSNEVINIHRFVIHIIIAYEILQDVECRMYVFSCSKSSVTFLSRIKFWLEIIVLSNLPSNDFIKDTYILMVKKHTDCTSRRSSSWIIRVSNSFMITILKEKKNVIYSRKDFYIFYIIFSMPKFRLNHLRLKKK